VFSRRFSLMDTNDGDRREAKKWGQKNGGEIEMFGGAGWIGIFLSPIFLTNPRGTSRGGRNGIGLVKKMRVKNMSEGRSILEENE